jgi:hypothetical protein
VDDVLTLPDWSASSTSYAEFADVAVAVPYDLWSDGELLSAAAFVVVMIAAVAEAISAHRLWQGIVTVAAPCVAFALVWIATPGTVTELDTAAAMALVLAAVAVREIWARAFAPRTV